MTRKERFEHIITWFQYHQPEAETELNYNNPYELLVAVILSAQCTDVRVNHITPALLKEFPNVEIMAAASPEEILPWIKSCSYPNMKSRHLVGMARTLKDEFNGVVPDQIDQLMRLPGVGRKTANVIASVVFNKPAMAVDTHVFRVSARLGLTRNAKNPLDTEMQLVKYIPRELISKAHHWLILHGRYICKARKPNCTACGLKKWCLYYEKL